MSARANVEGADPKCVECSSLSAERLDRLQGYVQAMLE